jgi:hypothetical protein
MSNESYGKIMKSLLLISILAILQVPYLNFSIGLMEMNSLNGEFLLT